MISAAELSFVRHEIASLASASPRSMVVYPLGKKSRQRVGIGNKSGLLSVFSLGKKMERIQVFETQPKQKQVSCATLYEDQLFVMHGSVLEAYSRKGKLFFSFDTNVTEVIHTISVFTPFIITCGSFMVTGFHEAKELGFYMAPDRVNAMVVIPVKRNVGGRELDFEDYWCILGCNDRMIRMLRSHKVVEESRCEAPVTALCISGNSSRVFYGTSAGSLGCFNLKEGGRSFFREFSYIPDDHCVAVTALALCDVNMDGMEELLVGRHDGSVHVFYIRVEEGGIGRDGSNGKVCNLACIWTGSAGESILSIAGGFITNSRCPDVLVHSLSGSVIAFSLEGEVNASVEEPVATHSASEITEAQIKEVSKEIEELKLALVAKTQELAECFGTKDDDSTLLATSATFTAKVALSQQRNSPALLLVVDADAPIVLVALQSDVRIRFLKMDSVDSVVRENSLQKSLLIKTLAVVQPLEACKHSCFVAFWMEEGSWGLLKVISLPAVSPRTAQVKVVHLRPLSLYARVGGIDKAERTTATEEQKNGEPALSVLQVTGNFTVRDMHSWLFRMLPGMPEIYQQKASTLRYEDVFFCYTLEVQYGDGTATFTTESLSTLNIIKCFINYCAAGRSIELFFHAVVHKDAVRFNLRRIVPHIAACNKAYKDAALLEALRALQLDEDVDMDCLTSEYKQLLEGADQVNKEVARADSTLGYLQGSLVRLYHSASDFVQSIPKMNSATEKILRDVGTFSDASEIMAALETLFFLT